MSQFVASSPNLVEESTISACIHHFFEKDVLEGQVHRKVKKKSKFTHDNLW